MKFVLRLLRKGFSPEAVALALMEVSPDLEIRKPKHVTDYIQRTIKQSFDDHTTKPDPTNPHKS